jgi:hypothetical protein
MLAWLDDPTTPKHSIRTIKFSRTTAELLVIVRRDNYRRSQDNGIALQTIRLDGPDGIVFGSQPHRGAGGGRRARTRCSR